MPKITLFPSTESTFISCRSPKSPGLLNKTVQIFLEMFVPRNSRKVSLGCSKNNTGSEKIVLEILLITKHQEIHLSSLSFTCLSCKMERKMSALPTLQGVLSLQWLITYTKTLCEL